VTVKKLPALYAAAEDGDGKKSPRKSRTSEAPNLWVTDRD
jgi:hypothetical protein